MGVVNTQATVQFRGADGDDSGLIVIERGSDEICPFGKVCLKIYPSAVNRVYASAGEVEAVSQRTFSEKKEYVVFQNTDSVQLNYPVVGTPVVNLDFVFNTTGQETGVSFFWDEDNQQLKASKTFFGAGLVTYLTDYRVWTYEPEINTLGGALWDGVQVLWGMILANRGNTFVTHQIDPIRVPSDKVDAAEIYRVYSEVIIAQDGAWETPSGWPDSTWSEDGAPTKDDVYITEQRVHEIGYIYPSHNIIDKEIYQRNVWELPKTGAQNYKPQYKGKVVEASEFAGTKYENSAARIDYSVMVDDLKARYKHIEGLPEYGPTT